MRKWMAYPQEIQCQEIRQEQFLLRCRLATAFAVMKKAYKIKSVKRESFGNIIIKILNFKSECRKYIYEEIQHITTRNS